MLPNILMTLAESPKASRPDRFAVEFAVDEEDCLTFARALLHSGNNAYFVNWDDFIDGEFSRMFHYNSSRFVEPLEIDSMSLIFSYKQEGFLFRENWTRYEEMLARFERSPAVVVNNPATIRWNRSKDYLFDLSNAGIAVIPTFQVTGGIRARVKDGEKFIVKPKIGERGLDQTLVEEADGFPRLNGDASQYLVQEFCPQIRDGERSLVYLGKDYSHAVIKRPNPDRASEYRCNESRGGSVSAYNPTADELEFASELLDHISLEHPVHFSRIDIVNVHGSPVLMEAELLNPSVFANYIGVGQEFGGKLSDYFRDLIDTQER